MKNKTSTIDEKYIQHTFELAQQSISNGDHAFGALIICNGEVIATANNTANLHDITGHAEANAIQMAVDTLGRKELSDCTIYSSFEPCAMCSFLIRDFNIGKVVFSVPSPHWGGVSRWGILTSTIQDPLFTSAQKTSVPEIVKDVLLEEGNAIYDKLLWKMHHE